MGVLANLQRSFANALFPSQFVAWIDAVSDFIDNFVSTGEVLNVPTVIGGAPSLLTIAPLIRQAAIVNGHTTQGDGGGGEFYYDPTNDNVTNPSNASGTVVVPTARIGLTGAWLRVFSGPINILWSGAGHGNAAQDTAAIQGVINETATLTGTVSQEIYFPLVTGGYLIDTAPILVQGALGKQTLKLTGELPGGPGSVGVIWHYTGAATASAMLHCLGTNGFKMSNIALDGAFATKFVLLLESDQPNNIGCSDTVLENVMLQSARNVAGAAHLALGNAAFGTGNTQCDDLRAYNVTIIGDPADTNYLADGILNRVGNNTKGHWFYGLFVNVCRYGVNYAAGGLGGFYGGGISVCFRAAFLLGSMPLYVRDVDFEGNNSFVSSAGQGDGQSALVFESCQVTNGHLWHIESGWDVDLDYEGGPLVFNGGFMSNARDLAIVDATNATPINVQLTPLPGQGADHQLQTGDFVQITGVAGNLAANGGWTITRVSATHITLNGSVGSGAYTGGGTVHPEPQIHIGDQASGSFTSSFDSEGTIWIAASYLNGPRVRGGLLELRDPAVAQAGDIRYRVKNGSGSVIGAADFRMPDIDTRNQRGKTGISLSPTTQNLTNANATIDVSTGKNQYVAQPRLYTANRTLTLGTTSAILNSTIIVVREDVEAHTLTVINGGPAAGTLSVLPASTAGTWIYQFDGVDWFELVNQVNLS